MRSIVVILASCVACGSDKARAPKAPQAAARPSAAATSEVRAYVDTVEVLGSRGPERSHARLVASLQALADVLEALGGEPTLRVGRIRALVTELEQSSEDGPHARLVSDALATALAAIEAQVRGVRGANVPYANAVHAYEQLAPSEPLLAQLPHVQQVLESLANALAHKAGLEPQFDSARIAGAPADVEAFRRHTTQIQDLVESVAAAPSSPIARERVVEALQKIAEAVRAAPSALDRGRVSALATRVSFAATRLARVSDTSLERTDLIASGLAAAVDALRQLANAPAGSPVAQLVERADTAVRGIGSSTFGFARARVQDALRAIADAYFVYATR